MNIKIRQLKVLRQILKNADASEFNIYYNLKSLLLSKDLYPDFIQSIPLFNYDTFYELWINKALKSKDKILWNKSFKYIAITSGTGSFMQKHLPYGDLFISSMLRSSRSLFLKLFRLGISPALFRKKILTIGGNPSLDQYNSLIVEHDYEKSLTAGFMSGIVFKESPKWFSSMYLPRLEVHKMPHWSDKMKAIIDEAPTYKIGTITGFPSYVLPLLNAIISKYQLSSIHDIWPDLKLYMHSGVPITQYRNGFEKCFGKHVDYFETYFATEGYFGYSTALNSEIMQLNLDSNIFYEFVKFNNLNFNEKSEVNPQAEVLPLWRINNNTPYALIVTNTSGLYRFIQGDLLIFSDVDKLHFKINGRISEMIGGSGEIIPVNHFTNSFLSYCELNDIHNYIDFFISTEKTHDNSSYNWFVVSDNLTIDEFSGLDQHLSSQMMLYSNYRNAGINSPCQIQIISEKKYEQFLYAANKMNGQAKMPKYLKGELKEIFYNFFTDTSE